MEFQVVIFIKFQFQQTDKKFQGQVVSHNFS